MRIASSMVASRSAMLVRWSVRTSRSNTKLMPEARCSTSKTLRSVTSRRSSEIGRATLGLSCTVAMAGLIRRSSMTRCSRFASRCCGFLGKRRAQAVLRLAVLAGFHQLVRFRHLHAMALGGLDLLEAGGGARVGAVVREDALVERFGIVEQARLAHQLRLREPLRVE